MHVSLKLFYWLWIDLQQHYAHKRCCKPASFSSVPFLSATPLLPCRLCTVAPTPKQHWTSATSTTPPPTSPPSASYRPRCAAWTAATSHNSWTTWCPGISYILFIIIIFYNHYFYINSFHKLYFFIHVLFFHFLYPTFYVYPTRTFFPSPQCKTSIEKQNKSAY